MDKARLRQRYCELRECLLETDVAAASTAICHHLAGWDPLRRAGIVLTYIAFRNEVDLSLLFTLLPDVRWVIPRITGKKMTLHLYDGTRLVRHRFGMLEPDASLPQIPPNELDIVLIPGVAFDPSGGRLGFGGGYYDRFLPHTGALRVGVTYDTCLAEQLPCGEFDQRMDYIATPAGVFSTGSRVGRANEHAPTGPAS